MKWFCLRYREIALLLLLNPLIAHSADQPENPIIEEPPVAASPWSDLPDAFPLSGNVVDPRGEPLADVSLRVDGERVARTDGDGEFAIPQLLSPDTLITFSHPLVADLSRAAGFLFSGEGRPVTVEMTPLDTTFTLTPAGGTYSAEHIRLEVPAGAVTENVTIHLAKLPLEAGFENTADVQLQPLSVLEFAPKGLTFKKPVTVSLDLDYPAAASRGVLSLFNADSGEFVPEPSNVVIAEGRAVFPINHFSRRTVGDPGRGIVKKHLGRTNDINGDGKLTSEDADFVILLSGGTQSAEFTIATTDSTTVTRSKSRGASEGTSSSASVGGGIEIGGSGIDVTHTVSREKSSEVIKKSGLEKSTESSTSSTSRLQAGEYELKCKYYTGLYDYYLVEEWALHKPNEWEQKALEEAYANRRDTEATWSYFSWNRSTGIAMNKTMYGLTRLALRRTGSGIDVYRMADSHVVRKRFATYPQDCKPGNMQRRIDDATEADEDAAEAAGSMKDNFAFFGGGDSESGYKGWGVLPESERQFRLGQECGNESEGEYVISSGLGSSQEEEQSRSTAEGSETSAEVSSGVGAGPVKISAKVGASSGSQSGRSEAQSYARNVMSSATTRVHWHIIDAHKTHYSDHMIAPLHNVRTVQGQDITRPIGIMVLRYKEYPCTTYTPTGAPSTESPDPTDTPDTDQARQQAGDPAKPAETAPPPSGAGARETDRPRDNKAAATENVPDDIRVQFSDLRGTLLINPGLIGQPRGIEVVGVDPEQLKADDIKAGTTAGYIQITASREFPDSAIFVQGQTRNLTITATGDAGGKESGNSRILAIGGVLVAVSGLLEATLDIPDELVEPNTNPADYTVVLGDSALTPVATKSDEIAVVGTDIEAPLSGSQTISVTSPSGATLENAVEIWSYSVEPQPVTRVKQWAPVTMNCRGYGGEVTVTFTPAPGQTIEPLEQVLSCDALTMPKVIAQYKTTVPGQQPLNVVVVRP